MHHGTSVTDSDQQKILFEFRKKLSDVLKPQHNDSYLLKWLRAKDFDISKAEQMLRVNLNTRELYQLDKILTEYKVVEPFITYAFSTFLGFDKEGFLVRLLRFGMGDIDGFVRTKSYIELGLYMAYEIESDIKALEEENKRTGRSADQIFYIIDMEGYSLQKYLQKHVIESVFDLMKIYQDTYPELIKSVAVINAPLYFYAVFNVLKPVLRRDLIEKIHVFTHDSWQEHLLKYIDAKTLPEILGGTSDIIVNVGRTIPPEMYAENQTLMQETDPGVKTVRIGPGTAFNVALIVSKTKSTIILEYRTVGQSIGLSLLYRKIDPEKDLNSAFGDVQLSEEDTSGFVNISHHVKTQSHLSPFTQTICCINPGIYAFRFDNTSSFFRANQLLYRTAVCEPIDS